MSQKQKKNNKHSKNPKHQSDPDSHRNPKLRKFRASIAKETLKISEQAKYEENGTEFELHRIDLDKDVVEYKPEDERVAKALNQEDITQNQMPTISVLNLGTISTCQLIHKRLMEERKMDGKLPDPSTQICALNFASAKNPGGGFMKGSMAQEESLCLCSNLYESTNRCRMYRYHSAANERRRDGLYNHFLIFSKRVTVFRDDSTLKLTSQPFELQFVTAPAVNAGVYLKRHPENLADVQQTMEERMRLILRVCALHQQKYLVLGAYGCGVFKNNPQFVAQTWMKLLKDSEFSGRFAEVAFGLLGDQNYSVFKEICGEKGQ